MSESLRLAVIGGGISGLTAAYRLTQLLPRAHIELFEASERLGGVLRTQHRDGLLIECGADSFIDKLPAAVDLCRELGLDEEIIPTNMEHRRALVLHDGKLHPVPPGFVQMRPEQYGPMLRTPLLSWRGKLRLLVERWQPRAPGIEQPEFDESVASFATRRMGREVLEWLVQPLLAGIYTADPYQLSVAATMPTVIEAERQFGSLRSASLAARENSSASGARYASFVTPRGGLVRLIETLAANLSPENIHLNAPIQGVTHNTDHRWSILSREDNSSSTYDGIVIALPAPRAAELLDATDAELSKSLRSIPYASSAVATLVYRREQIGDPLEGFGIVVPTVEGRQIVAVSFSSVKFPGRAPVDQVLLRVFLGGALQAELLEKNDGELLQVAKDELAEILGIRGEPLDADLMRWHEKMPQYHVGHLSLVKKIEEQVAEHVGLELAGNAYHGVGIPQCVQSGNLAAQRLLESLGTAT